jgi:hypothetical protein
MSKEVSNKVDVKDLAFPEITKLELDNSFNQLVAIMPEHNEMMAVIKESLPEIQRSTSLFFKTQSQFMDSMLTVSHNTPLRNIRQILAEMNQVREAIKEAVIKLKKKEIELKMKHRDLANEKDELKGDLLEVEILEIQSNADSTRGYISGAIRKLTNYTEQYNSIIAKHNIKDFTEEDFEKEEERYHIMKAFEQGLCSARSHGGTIDEGNHIYFSQIGINGYHAQVEVDNYLKTERDLLSKNIVPSHAMYIAFLNNMADHFAGSAEAYAKSKGMATMTKTALIQKGDTRLLDALYVEPDKAKD